MMQNERCSKGQKISIYWVTCAQLISMVLIVLSHAVPKHVDIPAFISTMTPYLQYAGLTVFMWTSGYLALITKQLEKYGYLGYLKRRVRRLLIPYFAFSLLMLVPKYVLSVYANSEVSLSPLFVLKQLITPREGIQPHLWFLPTLLFISLLLPFWKWSLQKTSTTAACSIALLVLQFIPTLTKVLCINDVLQYALWFYFGIVVAEKIDLSDSKRSVALFLPIILAEGGMYSLIRILHGDEQMVWMLYKLLCLSVIILASLLIQKPLQPVCMMFGRYSLSIYIISLPVQNIVNILCLKAGLGGIIIWLTMIITGCIVPYIGARIVELIDRKSKYKVLSTVIGL